MSMNEAVKAYGDERVAKTKLEMIEEMLKMDMSLEQALQATHLDEKTYRENLAKYADKN